MKYPKNHSFIAGKPDIEEKIVSVSPVYSKLGPKFTNESKKITKWVQDKQAEIIKKIEEVGDIFISDIPSVQSSFKEGLLKNGYIQVKKETVVKGKKNCIILPFDGFYLEF